MQQTTSISERIFDKARSLGFDRAAVVPAASLPHGEAYDTWLIEGRHGEMAYMENYVELRKDPRVLEPGTRSCVVLLKNYRAGSDVLDGGLRIARYAQGEDYHEVLRARMLELAAFIHAETGADVATRPAVDTAPLLERDLALAAGLGWIGKNAMLIHPEIGSYTFIAEILIDLDLEASHTRVPDRCGTCSRCLDACPTGAIVSPYIIDARRCISYLTIELRGPIPRSLRPLIGDHLFGCDICQAVCPWNRKAPVTTDPAFEPRLAYKALSPLDVLSLDHERYVEVFRKSAMKRAKLTGLKRNAAVVIGNRGDASVIGVLGERLEQEPEPLVRGHIAWALGRLANLEGGAGAAAVLEDARLREKDPYVLEEIAEALSELHSGRSSR
jgi:epoxyqueuosine reductase